MKSGNLLLLTATLVGAIFCAKSMNTQETRARQPFQLSSPAFQPGAAIPQQYSCQGADISPALHWGDAPLGTASFAIVVDDPDAPVGNWLHWTIWNIRAGAHDLAENVPKQEQLTDGSRQGRNDFRKIGYNGPCPPAGKTHRYCMRWIRRSIWLLERHGRTWTPQCKGMYSENQNTWGPSSVSLALPVCCQRSCRRPQDRRPLLRYRFLLAR